MKKKAATSHPSLPDAEKARNPGRLAVVGRHRTPRIRQLLRTLERAGHALHLFGLPDEFKSQPAQWDGILVVLDTTNGSATRELVRFGQQLAGDGPPLSPPIIFLSANPSHTDRVEALEAGVREYLSDTVSHRELKARVSNLVATQQRQALLRSVNQELEALSSRDTLTGLWNRRFADQTLNEELLRATRYGGSLALVLVDIDNFKQINDTYGHTVGDHVLMRVAGELQAACREVDRACRFGGEEFLLILPGTDEEGALFVAERVRTTVMGLPFLFADGRRTVTLSGGVIAFHPSPHCSQDLAPADLAHTLIHRADTGLYRAKAMGKNRMVVVSSKNVQKECRIFSRIQGR